MLIEQAEKSRIALLRRMLTPTRLIVPMELLPKFIEECFGKNKHQSTHNLHFQGMRVIFSQDATQIEAAYVLDKED